MLNVDENTIRFIGMLNRLCRQYAEYGIEPASKALKSNCLYFGLIFDDGNETIDGNWHNCPIINGMDGKRYDEIFPISITLAWSDCLEDKAPYFYPNIYVDIGDTTIYITEDGWYI